MAYQRHYLMSFGGSLQGGEIWSCGVRYFPNGDLPVTGDPVAAATMTALGAALKTWFQNPLYFMSNTAALKWVKWNGIETDGRYINKQHTNVADIAAGQGSTAPTLPAFTSVAITWRTGRVRPPGAWGRVYLPNFGIPLASKDPAIISGNIQDQLIGCGKALLQIGKQAQDAGGATVNRFIPCVASSVDGSLNIINEVSVGQRLDVQRRRENAISELFHDSPYNWQQNP